MKRYALLIPEISFETLERNNRCRCAGSAMPLIVATICPDHAIHSSGH